MLPLLLVGAVAAHYPHDFAFYVALPHEEDETWVVTSLFRTEAVMAARTDDFADIEVYYVFDGNIDDGTGSGDPVLPQAGEFLDRERLFMATSGLGLWESPDAGKSWSQRPDLPTDGHLYTLESSPAILEDGTAFLGGEGGIWCTRDRGDSWERVLEDDSLTFVDVSFSPGWTDDQSACAITGDGLLYCTADGGDTWSQAGTVETAQAWQLALGSPERIWVGTAEGLVVSQDGGTHWTPVPVDASVDGTDVTTVEYFGRGLLFATTRTEAVWRSTDSGETWTYCHSQIQDPVYTPHHDTNHYYEIQQAPSGRIWIASEEGLAYSDDGGVTWLPMETETGDTIRGLSFLDDQAGNGSLVMLASYGSGVHVLDPEVSWVSTISMNLEWLYFRSLGTAPDWLDSGVAMVTGSGRLYVTSDHGATWTRTMDVDLYPNIAVPAPDYAEHPLVLVAAGAKTGAFYYSEDDGATWTEGVQEGGTCSSAARAIAYPPGFTDGSRAWGACGAGQVFYTEDRGRTWTYLGEAGPEPKALAVTPDSEKLFLATDDGLWAFEPDNPEPTLLAFEGEPVWGVVAAPDWDEEPYVYAVTLRQGWYRSTDGGLTFERLDAPTEQIPLRMAISPHFETDGTLAVAGFGGAWISRDRGETWSSLHAVEYYEQTQPQFLVYGHWGDDEDGTSYATTTAGAYLLLRVRGVGIDLIGPQLENGGTLSISLDGSEPEDISTAGEPAERQVLWSATDLEDTWHEVRIEAVGDGVVEVDAARVWKLPGVELGPDFTAGEGLTGDTGSPDTASPDTASPDTASPDTSSPDTGAAGAKDTGSPAESRCSGCAAGSRGAPYLPLLLLLPALLRARRR